MKRIFLLIFMSALALTLMLGLSSCSSEVKFKLNFIVDGTVYETVETVGNEIISIPKSPTKDGYDFGGWYWDDVTFEEKFLANSLANASLTSDVSVYAKWLCAHTPVTDARVEPTFTETGLTEGSHCSVCGEILVAQEIIPVISSKSEILSNVLMVNGENVSGKVSYETDNFNFMDDISVTNNASWILSTDVYGIHAIVTKSAPLNEGENIFYIHVVNPDQTLDTYTVSIYRNHLYTVSFDTDGGTSVEPQYVEEGYLATVPSTTKTGYTFASWSYDFTTPIIANTVVKASWNANTNTAYRIEYYLENVDKNGYEILASETENLFGTTDTTANAEQKTFEHFTLNTSKSTLVGNISGNGSLVLKVYYTRNTYTVSTSQNNNKGGMVTSGGTYAYDTEITLTATTNTGYTFLGWFDGETKVCASLTYTFKVDHTATYTAKWSANTNTSYTVEYYLENIDKNGYDIVSAETENLFGTTDTTANAEQKTFEHFTLDTAKSTLSGNINADGSLVLKVYYTRNTYTVKSSDMSLGTVSNSGNYVYGKTVNLTAESNLGCNFKCWYSGGELISANAELTIEITGNIEARFEISSEMSNFSFTSTKTTCEITGIKDKSVKEITIPDYVTSISRGAFSGCYSLESITLPFVGSSRKTSSDTYQYPFGYIFGTSSYTGGVATKQDYYGSSTSYITSITYYIPSSLKSVTITGGNILRGAFYECTSLTSVVIGNGVTSIGSSAFFSCGSLKSVTIPDTVTTIGSYAFYECSSLTSVLIGDSVTSIGDYTFYDCTSLTSVTIPDSVTSIGSSAFYSCYKLVEVINKSSLTFTKGSSDYGRVAYYAIEVHNGESRIVNQDGYLFYTYDGVNYLLGYAGNATELTLPDNYNGQNYDIYKYAFYNCDSLTSVVIGDSVTTIGDDAFSSCDSLTSVTIPDTVTTIGSYAFSSCDSLTSVTIGNGVTTIGDYAFVGCDKLVEVINKSSLTFTKGSSDYGQVAYFATEVHNGESRIVNQDGYLFYTYDGVNYLLGYAGNATELTLPDNYNGQNYDIYKYAFYNCDSLTSVVIGDSVTTIGDDAFYNCDSLTSVTIPDSVTSIGNAAFASCHSLTSVTIGNGVKSIGSMAFYNCYSLTSVTIGNGVTTIGDSAFASCHSLTSIKYRGTQSQWNAISKDSYWNRETGSYTITYNYTGN